MLEIITQNNVKLDLLPDTKISLELFNPMFNMIGSHSVSFNIPDSPTNRKELGYPGRADSILRKNSIRVKIRFNGLTLFDPLLYVKSVSDSIGVYLAIDEGGFYSRIKDKKLTDLAWENGTFSNVAFDTLLKDAAEGQYPDYKFVAYPVMNKEFFKDSTQYQLASNRYQNHYRHTGLAGMFFTGANKLITPFIYLAYVLDNIANHGGLGFSKNLFFDDLELRSLTIFNVNSIKRTGELGGVNTVYHNLKNHLPDILISEFLNSVNNKFCTTLFVNDVLADAKLINNSDIIRSAESDEFTYKVKRKYDLEFEDADGAKIAFERDGNDAYYKTYMRDIYDSSFTISEPVNNYVQLLGITTDPAGTIRYNKEDDIYYHWALNESTGVFQWKQYSRNDQAVVLGNGKKVWNSKISSFLDTWSSVFDEQTEAYHPTFGDPLRYWVVPIVEIPGNDMYWGAAMYGRSFGLRLKFYRGMHADSNGNLYPFASNNILDPDGLPISGLKYVLSNQGEKGLFKSFWEPYFEWNLQDSVKGIFEINLSEIDIANLQFWKKKRIENQNYLFDKVSVTISPTRIELSKVEARRI